MQFELCITRFLSRAQRTSLLGAIGLLAAAGLLLTAAAPLQAHAQQNGVLIDQVGPNNAADNDATQNVSGSGNVVQAGQGRLDIPINVSLELFDGQESLGEGTATDNEVTQIIDGNKNAVQVLQGVGVSVGALNPAPGTARDNVATQNVNGNRNNTGGDARGGVRIAQGVINGTALENVATQDVDASRNEEVSIFQGIDGGLAVDNEATQDVDGSGHKLVGVLQGGRASGVARRNEATQRILSGSNHRAVISQGVESKAFDNVATQNLSGSGHTAYILQEGQGNTATQIVNN